MLRSGAVIACVVAFALVACGDDEADGPSTASPGPRAAIEDRLVRYFERNFEGVDWYSDIHRFEIQGGTPVPDFLEIEDATVVVYTGLDQRARDDAREICAGVFGADVADSGGTARVLGEDGELIAECPSDL